MLVHSRNSYIYKNIILGIKISTFSCLNVLFFTLLGTSSTRACGKSLHEQCLSLFEELCQELIWKRFGQCLFSLVNSSIIQSLFMQNHLLHRYFHFNCRKKPWGKKKRKNASVFGAGIVFFKILIFYCVTSTPMDSTGNSGKCCLEITWASLLVEAEAASTQVSPACALTHTTNTHTHLCVCVHAHTHQMTTFIGLHYF